MELYDKYEAEISILTKQQTCLCLFRDFVTESFGVALDKAFANKNSSEQIVKVRMTKRKIVIQQVWGE